MKEKETVDFMIGLISVKDIRRQGLQSFLEERLGKDIVEEMLNNGDFTIKFEEIEKTELKGN